MISTFDTARRGSSAARRIARDAAWNAEQQRQNLAIAARTAAEERAAQAAEITRLYTFKKDDSHTFYHPTDHRVCLQAAMSVTRRDRPGQSCIVIKRLGEGGEIEWLVEGASKAGEFDPCAFILAVQQRVERNRAALEAEAARPGRFTDAERRSLAPHYSEADLDTSEQNTIDADDYDGPIP